jgi:hypothetical protein
MPGTIRRVGHSFNLNNVKPTQCIPTGQSLSNGTKLEAGDKRCHGVGDLIITNKSNKVLSLKQSTFLSLIDRLEYFNFSLDFVLKCTNLAPEIGIHRSGFDKDC